MCVIKATRSLGLNIKRGVVAELEEIDVLVCVIVEQNGGACLALEIDAELLLVGHLQDLNLHLRLLVDGFNLGLTFLCGLVNLLLNLEVELPGLVGDYECLAIHDQKLG